ncbi:Cys-tRNA(Pro)/Cys-tRNA(Cys) deacylase ybaK [Gluconacetobacter sp. SXCC-1]|uniref:Cys-tRNA(Pro)/Cys-tRNA(Cys) deacylase n=1 Tax=Komagataeibacter rhaeticus TaxID=215221 RepID=A0A181C6X0_9PROT|nr:Cys-tRNA(Pro) deacylase [Komagataeibacter rhaeticus]ATU73826.1 Cys-tRNA(Pro) deacylase [Komagataeibacter xylinus]EGG78398.1 Cys-tRNA(Pro)/Cys-tRNA(Cys) deacylase ybaK [Gluconacetobacter sp. SXCC-1]QIP34279.1 Cys-tRNA(Pro) deacylase [Komagataeibacter rhaeticus]QOC46789.1 Cys-tRNA(Pro) deacylase [Komagataeibacter rhaeticus]WPP20833.1 Cys-tRNA(Pro) deacylase [Komagataeibacter rhaeticus]
MSRATPATAALQKAGIAFDVVEYEYDPTAGQTGNHAAASIGENPDRVFKTLMVLVDRKPACVVVPVAATISMKKVAAAFGGKSAEMMPPTDAERATGYHVGGISPFGQRRRVTTALAREALDQPHVIINGGKRGYLVRLSAADAIRATSALTADLLA